MTTNLEGRSVEEPTILNLDLGDYLVGFDQQGKICLGEITNLHCSSGITATCGNLIHTIPYEDAIVFKRDGNYLIGKNVQKQLAQSKNKLPLSKVNPVAGLSLTLYPIRG